MLHNVATVSGAVRDSNPFNDQAAWDTTVQSRATLQISKVDRFDPVAPGGALFYQIAVTNTGPSAARQVTVTDVLPAGVIFQAAGLGCVHDGSVSGGTLTCTLASLAVNDTALFDITAFAPLDVVSGTVLTNSAVARASNAAAVNAAVTTTVQQTFGPPADLQVRKTGDAVALAGGRVAYTVVVTNSGPAIATGVDLKDVLPAGVTLGSAQDVTTTQGLCFPSPFGALCQFGNLAVGQVVTVTLVGDVAPGLAAGQVLTNTAQVFGGNADPEQPPTTRARRQTTVTASADLSIVKSATPVPAAPGQSLTYLLTVSNAGPSDAQAVVVTDTLPAGLHGDECQQQPGCVQRRCHVRWARCRRAARPR